MRKLKHALVQFFLLFIISYTAKAQLPCPIEPQVFIGNFPPVDIPLPDSVQNLDLNAGMVLGLRADLPLRDHFSFGLVSSFQMVKVLLYEGNEPIESGRVRKCYLGIRGLWHYGKTDKWDLYSGLKLGYSYKFPRANVLDGHTSIIENWNKQILFQVGITAIGCKYQLPNDIGLHGELSIGAPCLFSLGFSKAFY